MAKLRKARNGTLAPPAPSATSSSSSPAAPGGSTSTPARRPPSLLSTSSAGKRTSPIAVRSTGTLAPSVSASRIEARGELIEGELSEAESRSVTLHSRCARADTFPSLHVNTAERIQCGLRRSPTASSFHSRGTASSLPPHPGRTAASPRTPRPPTRSSPQPLLPSSRAVKLHAPPRSRRPPPPPATTSRPPRRARQAPHPSRLGPGRARGSALAGGARALDRRQAAQEAAARGRPRGRRARAHRAREHRARARGAGGRR